MKNRAILTVTRNSTHIWKYFVESFKDYCTEYDLFVWDNGSGEGHQEYLETYADERIITLFCCPFNMLFTYATNGCIEAALENRYEQIVIVNPDIEFKEGWDVDLETNEGIMGFTLVKPNGIIEHAGGVGGGDHLGRGERDTGQYQGIRDVEWVTFGAAAISRSALTTLGKLDEAFPHFGSDREYCALAKTKGIPVRCSGARLVHGFGKSSRPYVFAGIPDDIWKLHVAERRASGVNFPERQEDCARVDAPGRYMNLMTGVVS